MSVRTQNKERQEEARFDPFAGPGIQRIIPTTEPQQEIWISCLLGGDDASKAYNESVSLRLNGNLQRPAIDWAMRTLVDRHEALRAFFSPDGRYMCIAERLEFDLAYQDLSNLNPVDTKKALTTYALHDVRHAFDLINGPLFKAGLIKTAPKEHVLVITAHHIVCDGWSTGILLEELGALYSAYIEDRPADLPTAESYGDYADVQVALVESAAYMKIERFWLNQFKDGVPTLNLPTDFERPKTRTYKSNRLDFEMDEKLLGSLKKLGMANGCSLVTTLMASFELFLHCLTGQTDLVVGLPAAGQSATGMNQLIGHCVNMLPMKSHIDVSVSFKAYLKIRKTQFFDAYEQQQLTFGRLLKKMALARDPSRVPLIPVVFNVDLGMSKLVKFMGLEHELASNPRDFETFELFLNATGFEDNMLLEWTYNTALFTAASIEGMMRSFEHVIAQLTAEPDFPISRLKLEQNADKTPQIKESTSSYPALALNQILAEKAAIHATSTAISFHGTTTTYAVFQDQANRFAHYLNSKGVKQGDRIALALPKSADMLIGLLGILQCGAAYVPLDPSYPTQRLSYMLEDAMVSHLLTTKGLVTAFDAWEDPLFLEDAMDALASQSSQPLDISSTGDSLAYILYTSGSTGQPKGVEITHKNLVNFLYSMLQEPGITAQDRLLSITTISFDIVGLELFLPLLVGATLVIADRDTARDGRLLLQMIKEQDITILQATPTTWQMLLDAGWQEALPLKALCGGEALPLSLAKKIMAKCNALWNMYGPTETTIWSTIKQVQPSDEIISIGRPIANTQIHILDEQGALTETGTVGEITIGGDGLANGYWNKPTLTAQKFIKNPFGLEPKDRLYRTGDLGRILPNGELECLGRMDHQVKIRGHRIELGEIEEAIATLPNVRFTVVVAEGNNLTAHIVPLAHALLGVQEQVVLWRKQLTDLLPLTLIPQEFLLIESLPTTLNGKVDRNALKRNKPAIEVQKVSSEPRTQAEQIVAEIWMEFLNLKKLDIFSNFFELGGHSLIAVQVMTKIEWKTGKRLPLASLFEHATVAGLAKLLDMDTNFITWDSLVPIKPKGTKTPLYIVHGGGLNVLIFNAIARHMDEEQPVFGLQAKGLDGIEEPLGSIREIAAHYIMEIIAQNPNGPYILAGYSAGGLIAFEMAIQLRELGKTVEKIIMLDTYLEPFLLERSPLGKKIAKIKYWFGKVGHITKRCLTSVSYVNQRIDYLEDNLQQIYNRFKLGAEQQHQLRFQQPLKLDEMTHKAVNEYLITPQPVKVHILRARKTTYYMHDHKNLGWLPIALKGVAIYDVHGEHSSMFDPPNDISSAQVLQTILNERVEH